MMASDKLGTHDKHICPRSAQQAAAVQTHVRPAIKHIRPAHPFLEVCQAWEGSQDASRDPFSCRQGQAHLGCQLGGRQATGQSCCVGLKLPGSCLQCQGLCSWA